MTPRPARTRLDALLVARGLAPTRNQAQALIIAGRVSSAGQRLDKPGRQVAEDLPLELAPGRRWVGRGGFKLSAALQTFGIESDSRDAIDVGASTGGFTQVMLEAGFARVIALDVGRGQLDWGLRNDVRVEPVEGVNARNLTPDILPFSPEFASVDVSFISLKLVLPAVVSCLTGRREVVALVKPQFEAGRDEVGRGGIVRRPETHRRVLETIVEFIAARSWAVAGLCNSAIRGTEGNREFFVYFRPDEVARSPSVVNDWIDRTLLTEEERP